MSEIWLFLDPSLATARRPGGQSYADGYDKHREVGLSLRKRKCEQTAAMTKVIFPTADRPNERWSTDFVTDTIVTSCRFCALVIVDDHSRECPAIGVDNSLGGRRLVQVMERLAASKGSLELIMLDSGSESNGKALHEWTHSRGVKLNFIRPGKPIENAYAESFVDRLRNESLNQNCILSLEDARDIIEAWQIEYNDD